MSDLQSRAKGQRAVSRRESVLIESLTRRSLPARFIAVIGRHARERSMQFFDWGRWRRRALRVTMVMGMMVATVRLGRRFCDPRNQQQGGTQYGGGMDCSECKQG